jgi:hypothetical protein
MGPKRGLEWAQANTNRALEKIPKTTIFQNPIQKNSFPENFTWVEAVRKNPPAELFIFGSYFPPMVLYAHAQLRLLKGPRCRYVAVEHFLEVGATGMVIIIL